MSFKEQPFYRYEPLDKSGDTFRLFRLLPGSGEAAIRCELINNASISAQSGLYSALSYTWGKKTSQRWMHLDGTPYHLQPNLLQALRAIRKVDEAIVVWADAICIDQRDFGERNHQVSRMGDIYRNAKSVLAWIGPAADDSDAFFDYLDEIGKETAELKESATVAMSFLNKRPYWRRAWIKQELVLAKEITVFCGTRSSRNMESFFWFASLNTIDEVEGYEDYILKIYMHRISMSKGEHNTLEALMHVYNYTERSDPRDGVFALLSMASDCKGLENTLVDYSLSLPALFFYLLARFEPRNVSEFASLLQDVLGVRRVELLKYWNEVALDEDTAHSPPNEQVALEYIHKIKTYSERLASSLPAPNTNDFIFRSFLAQNEEKLEKQKTLGIKDTKFCLHFIPTLFGYHLIDISKAEIDKYGKPHDWQFFRPSFTAEEVWKTMILTTNILANDGPLLWDPARIAYIKDAVVQNDGQDAVQPSIDVICFAMLYLMQENDAKGSRLCLADCRYLVSSLYGFSFMRMSQVKVVMNELVKSVCD